MSEPEKERNTPKSSASEKLDSTTASAVLAEAVKSAETSSAKPAETKPAVEAKSAEPASDTPDRPSPKPIWQNHHARRAAAIAVAIGLGWAGGSLAVSGRQPAQSTHEWVDPATSGIRQNEADLLRLTGDVRILKAVVESMKESLDQTRIDGAGQQRAFVERVEGVERIAHNLTTQMAHVVNASERLEHNNADAGLKLSVLSGRLDGLERQTAAAAKAASPMADGPQQTGALPDAKTASKQRPLEGWVLHDVQRGIALIESRNGRLHEVAAGQTLPTVGRVEAIERRGRAWVVVTSKGIIGPESRWQ
jgi:hypothetical protein